MKVKVIVITGDGINCEVELAHSFNKAGAQAQIVHMSDFIQNPQMLHDYHIMALPGGFSYADELGSGKVVALKLEKYALDEINKFIEERRPVIGICNGMQMLTKLGVFDTSDYKVRMAQNKETRFIDRWEKLNVVSSHCLWTRDIKNLYLPIRHAEGRLVSNVEGVDKLLNKKVALTYANNPNGSVGDIAGLTNEYGNVFALMPHPEAAIDEALYPGGLLQETLGLAIFENAIQYVKDHL